MHVFGRKGACLNFPTLILLPGLHGTADLFHPLRAVVPKDFHTRTVEYPATRCFSQKALLRHIELQTESLSDLILFAESFSGHLALRFAVRHASRVRAVILCGTFIRSPVPPLLSLLAPIPILLRIPIPAFAIRLFLAGAGSSREQVREARRAIQKNRPHVLAHRVLQTITINATEDLRRCGVPILCLAGTRDRLLGKRGARRIHNARPDIQIYPIHAPHLLLQTRPAEVWAAVEQFLHATASVQSAPV